jgi:hypothetical protein
MGEPDFMNYVKFYANVNWGLSVLLLDEKDEIKGVYILGNNQITCMIDSKKYKKLKGVEGILLCVDESLRGQGFGNTLKDYPKTLNVDYVWGQQFKGLNNLNDWLKRRELVGETSEVYITVEIFNILQ